MHWPLPALLALHRPADWLALAGDAQSKMDRATSVGDLLFTLLRKGGAASSFAALRARWNAFRRVLFTEERDPDQKLKLMLFMTPALIVGVTLRLVGGPPYAFADLSLEGDFLMGRLGGRGGGADRQRDHHDSGADLARMAGDARGVHRGVARRIDPAGDSQQRRSLELRAVHVSEYSESDGETVAQSGIVVGDGAAFDVHRPGAGTRGAGRGYQAELALRD